jgi:HSP20 family protein
MFARTFWDDFSDFRHAVDQVFDSFSNHRPTGNEREWTFTPAVETGWTDDYLNLRVVLPGVKQEHLKVTTQGTQLVIQGERKAPEDFGKEGAVYNQLAYGKFERTLDLPNGLDVDKLQAHLHDGLLDVRIPVAQAVKPKQIKITSGAEAQKSITA